MQFALLSIHTSLAAVSKIPELELTEQEAEKLAKGIANVAQYYPVAIDPKTQAWLALIAATGSVYGTRFIAYRARIKTEEREKPRPDNIAPFKMQP